jgi:hypothetical protein
LSFPIARLASLHRVTMPAHMRTGVGTRWTMSPFDRNAQAISNGVAIEAGQLHVRHHFWRLNPVKFFNQLLSGTPGGWVGDAVKDDVEGVCWERPTHAATATTTSITAAAPIATNMTAAPGSRTGCVGLSDSITSNSTIPRCSTIGAPC